MAELVNIKMEPGKKYKGTAWCNEYGEFNFRAQQKRADGDGNMKLVKEVDDYALYESKNYLKVAVKVKKTTDKVDMIKQFITLARLGITLIRNYKFTV